MKSFTRIVTGLLILLAGIVLLLGNFNLYDLGELWRTWWPLIPIVAGILMYLNDSRNYAWALFVILIGGLFQLNFLGIMSANPWQLFWPAVLIFAGLSVLLNRSATRPMPSKAERDNVSAVLGGSDVRNISADFKGSTATAIMGGIKLDLRKTTIKHDATIQVFAFWSGIEIIVPRGVIIRNQTSVVLGGVEDKTEQEATNGAPVLYITGDVIMAGVEIKN